MEASKASVMSSVLMASVPHIYPIALWDTLHGVSGQVTHLVAP